MQAILTRPIQWELIEAQFDEIIKFATALRLGTADTEVILRRFTRSNVQHPTYKALVELGKALKMIFLCDSLRLESLHREIHEGLHVIDNWNSANDRFGHRVGHLAWMMAPANQRRNPTQGRNEQAPSPSFAITKTKARMAKGGSCGHGKPIDTTRQRGSSPTLGAPERAALLERYGALQVQARSSVGNGLGGS